MGIYTVLSLVAFAVYLTIGTYTLDLDKKSRLNRMFFAWCISMAVWSLGYSVVYSLKGIENSLQEYIWLKISAIGWCSFSSIVLHLTLLLTENKNIQKLKNQILIYVPSVVFFMTSVIFFRPNYKTPYMIEKFFYTGDFIYNFSFLLASIWLVFIWGKKSENVRVKKQSVIICLVSIIPFVLNLATQTILPLFGFKSIDNIGQVYTLIMVFGIYYVIKKYRLFNITTDSLIDEILSNMMDLFILLSPKGKIIRVSNSTEKLLKYNKGEIINKSIDSIIYDKAFLEGIYNSSNNGIALQYDNLDCFTKDGDIITISGTCSFIADKQLNDILGIAIVGHDIMLMKELEKEVEEHKEAERMLKENQERFIYLAYHDSLTGLPNRKYFYESLFIQLKKSKRTGSRFAVFFLDLDGFKGVNDSYGHEMGDILLCEVARRLKSCIRETDIAARIGGDEFIILITDIHTIDDAMIVKDKIDKLLGAPVQSGDIIINTRASIGISIYPDDGEDVDALINKADNRMYIAKGKKL